MYILIVAAYLFGSVNSAILVCKAMGLPSPRSTGSKNPGATNVLRLGGKKAAGLTFAGDVLKGVIPIIAGYLFHLPAPFLCWVALAAILGHIYPIFFDFKGGKGVATAFGCFFALNLPLGICVIATWLLIAKLTHYSSLSSILSILLTPVYAAFLIGLQVLPPIILIAALIIFRHQSNIQKLFTGSESKIGQKRYEAP